MIVNLVLVSTYNKIIRYTIPFLFGRLPMSHWQRESSQNTCPETVLKEKYARTADLQIYEMVVMEMCAGSADPDQQIHRADCSLDFCAFSKKNLDLKLGFISS
jgi:hypothetical protein